MEIKIMDISKKYGDLDVLKNISLNLYSGGIYGLIGSNGAGKTTLIKILTTLEKPTSGKILLDGINLIKYPNEIRNKLGYLPQDVNVYPHLTAVEYLRYFAGIKGIDKQKSIEQLNYLLDLFGLSRYPNKRLGTYSGGMKQRIGLACALLGNPKIIILDEPSVGLDPEERIKLRKLFEDLAKDRIVLLSTHIISDIELTAQNIIVMKDGAVKYEGEKDRFCTLANGKIEDAYLKLMNTESNYV